MYLSFASLVALATSAAAKNLFVSSYAGSITSLSLTESYDGYYDLRAVSSTNASSPNPSWLTLSPQHRTLYCMDEGLEVPNGSLTSYKVHDDGSLVKLDRKATISGPVSGVIYNGVKGSSAMAIAHYTGHGLSVWDLSRQGQVEEIQNFTFTLPHPGANPVRQDSSHPHEAILDPTGQYVLSPDLGADLVRVFKIDPKTTLLKESEPLKLNPGYGPRHGLFWFPRGKPQKQVPIYFYLVSELTSHIDGFKVTYPAAGGISFEKIFETTSYGGPEKPDGALAAEIQLSPDNRFITVSNRNDSSFIIPSTGSGNSTNATIEYSDSLATFKPQLDGSLDFVELAPAGGSIPRQFSISKTGEFFAVGLSDSSRVVILARDIASGVVLGPVAEIHIDGEVTCVVWDE
ncbi:putative isomerase YbhE [Xylona heveae TC161]|uniref:Putative isomerase YbhE n=1 Tax=Xylona heveae (strain CBS 132557 / TC161) TaxID=1328760 RepID=A0A164ZM34_XYLHT|nr:putative isomerase YbhE [Xylona heveae TC161]KZF19265.1 putative isomerase YbhE [Xylona heveae TC161]